MHYSLFFIKSRTEYDLFYCSTSGDTFFRHLREFIDLCHYVAQIRAMEETPETTITNEIKSIEI